MRPRPWCILLILLALLPVELRAQTAIDQRARELYDNGVLLYEEGRYEDAIAAWQEAYRLSDRPLLLFNIANAQERVGRWAEALESLNRYRAFAPRDERDVLDRRMRNIERRLEEQRAEEQAQPTPAPVPVAPAASEPKAAEGPSPAGIALLIGGVAGAAVGAGLDGAALATRGDARALCAPHGDGLLCPDSVAPLLQRDRQLSLAGDISLIAGGAVAATGLVLTLVQATARPQAVLVLPSLGPGGFALTVAGSF